MTREEARQVLTDWLGSSKGTEEQLGYIEGWFYKEDEEAFHMAIEALQDDWIPVSEKLPNTNGIFIVTRRISDGFECRNITDACYFDGSSTWHDDTRVNHERKNIADVLAWRPLPEPYKESEE